ncbi:hypothetical protein [Phocaeicola abscessus]
MIGTIVNTATIIVGTIADSILTGHPALSPNVPTRSKIDPLRLGNLKFDVPNPVGYVGEPVRRRSEPRRIRRTTCPLRLDNLKFDVPDVSE